MSEEEKVWGDFGEEDEKMSSSKSASNNLDTILSKLGATVGKYQILNYVYICIPVIFSAFFTVNYIFTSRNLDYRCHIPECDPPNPVFNPLWLSNAVPSRVNHQPSRCERYASIAGANVTTNVYMCPTTLFNRNKTETCHNFVFDTDEVNILNDFGLMCDENLWKLTLVGTINSIGQFVCLPISGYISDRYGRRSLMLGGLLSSILIGLSRSFAPSYLWFLFFEFLDTAIGSGAYSSAFILAVEFVSPDKRVLSGSLVSSYFAVGEATVGAVAWSTQSWRTFLRFLYVPGIILIAFFWIIPESVRWLLAKGRTEEAKNILRRAARINDIELSDEELKNLDCEPQKQDNETAKSSLKDILKSPILMLRMLNCSFCWITCNFVYYGLSLNSVAVAGNMYLNYISVSLIEIPAYFTTYLILDRFGRRLTLCGSLLTSGLACLVFLFLPEDAIWLRLSVFLCGKFGITISFTVLYVFTTELFPTSLRHSLLGTCSMFGRTGSMIAPQTPLLAQIMEALPLILFGAMSVASGLLVLLFPETLNIKLPDTLEEAELIGQKEKSADPI